MRLVICAPTTEALHTELRTLNIPPHAFLRRDIVVLIGGVGMERVKGIKSYHWTATPDYKPGMNTVSTLMAGSHERLGGRLTWLEAIARVLAHRQYHEQ